MCHVACGSKPNVFKGEEKCLRVRTLSPWHFSLKLLPVSLKAIFSTADITHPGYFGVLKQILLHRSAWHFLLKLAGGCVSVCGVANTGGFVSVYGIAGTGPMAFFSDINVGECRTHNTFY